MWWRLCRQPGRLPQESGPVGRTLGHASVLLKWILEPCSHLPLLPSDTMKDTVHSVHPPSWSSVLPWTRAMESIDHQLKAFDCTAKINDEHPNILRNVNSLKSSELWLEGTQWEYKIGNITLYWVCLISFWSNNHQSRNQCSFKVDRERVNSVTVNVITKTTNT